MPSTRSDLVLERLRVLHPKVIDLSLGRIERLLDALGHPERRLPPTVHIAGTNGKGSTLAMLSAMLRGQGAARRPLHLAPPRPLRRAHPEGRRADRRGRADAHPQRLRGRERAASHHLLRDHHRRRLPRLRRRSGRLAAARDGPGRPPRRHQRRRAAAPRPHHHRLDGPRGLPGRHPRRHRRREGRHPEAGRARHHRPPGAGSARRDRAPRRRHRRPAPRPRPRLARARAGQPPRRRDRGPQPRPAAPDAPRRPPDRERRPRRHGRAQPAGGQARRGRDHAAACGPPAGPPASSA